MQPHDAYQREVGVVTGRKIYTFKEKEEQINIWIAYQAHLTQMQEQVDRN